MESSLIKGQVVVSHSSEVIVQDAQSHLCCCKILKKSDRPVCGDFVEFDPATRCVLAVLPRSNVLIRPDGNGKIKPLAANMDQFVIVTAVVPLPDFNLIDRYLVAAEDCGCSALIVLNKTDLPDFSSRPLASHFKLYESLGYPVISTNWSDTQADQSLLRCLAGRTSILVGQSGVGKSSLVSRLIAQATVRTGELSGVTGAGRHTTTTTTRYDLPEHGHLIDSPGVRAFRLWNLSREQLEYGFREMRPFFGQCRFTDCHHINEPDCAIRAAIADGHISDERFERFQMIASSLAAR